MRDGAIVANSGHFNVELDLAALRQHGAGPAARCARIRPGVRPGAARSVYLVAEGRLVNLAAAEGHPAAVMDMSFANQALCAEWMVQEPRQA